VIIVVVIEVAACLSARAVPRRKLAGDKLDDWEWCRKQLGHRGAMRVVRTTTRRRVLDRPDLKEAQLVHVLYCVHVAGRARLHHRLKYRFMAADVYFVLSRCGVTVRIECCSRSWQRSSPPWAFCTAS
jgi:hypothetical protein